MEPGAYWLALGKAKTAKKTKEVDFRGGKQGRKGSEALVS